MTKHFARTLLAVSACLAFCVGGASLAADVNAGIKVATSDGIIRAGAIANLPGPVANRETLLRERDSKALTEAYKAIKTRNWPKALSEATRIRHPIAKKIITWSYLTADNTDPAFDEVVEFLEENPEWPLQEELLRKAEKALPQSMPPARLIAWFAGQEPYTGEGMIRLGEALIATGEQAYGERWIGLAWAAHDFSNERQREIFLAHKAAVSGQPTIDRINRLLWSSQATQAQWLMPKVSEDLRAVAQARIALMRQLSGAPALVTALPAETRMEPGIIFDNVRYLRRQRKDDEARARLADLASPETAPHPERFWIERNVLARRAIEDENFEGAYAVLAKTGLTSGGAFADAEWLAGWLCLRFLDRPEDAYQHFIRLSQGVSFPISLSRAHYWAGRAAEAMGDNALAIAAYEQGTQFPYTYYGQLSAESPLLVNQKLTLASVPDVPPEAWKDFLKHDLITAVRLIREIDEERYVRTFSYTFANNAESEIDLVMLAELLLALDQPAVSVRIAKRANQSHKMLTEYMYPVPPVPRYIGHGDPPEPALVLGLSRQESEFNPRAISSANARGIMQLIPSTAKITARKHGLPYNRSRLTSDPEYNMQLGMAHLSDLLERFDGSYILTIAAYNAGGSRASQWIEKFGDPRTKDDLEVIDWIEMIPFSETRNYVQRVTENLQVYRHRISGRPLNFTLMSDLKRTTATPPNRSYLTPQSGPMQGEGTSGFLGFPTTPISGPIYNIECDRFAIAADGVRQCIDQ